MKMIEGSRCEFSLVQVPNETSFGNNALQSSNPWSSLGIWPRKRDESRQASTSILPPHYSEGQKPESIYRVDTVHEEILYRIEFLLQSCLQSIRAHLWNGTNEDSDTYYFHADRKKSLEVDVKRVTKASAYLLDVTLALQPCEIFLQNEYSSILIHLLDILSSVASHCRLSQKAPQQAEKAESTESSSALELGMFENLVVQVLLFLQAWIQKSRSKRNRIINSTTLFLDGINAEKHYKSETHVTFSYGGASLAILQATSLLMNAKSYHSRYIATSICFDSFPDMFEQKLPSERETENPVSYLTAYRISIAFAYFTHAIDSFQVPDSCIASLVGKYIDILQPLLVVKGFESLSPNDFASEWSVSSSNISSVPRIWVSKRVFDIIQFTKNFHVDDGQHSRTLCNRIVSSYSTKEMSDALFSTMIESLLFAEVKKSVLDRVSVWRRSIERILSVPPSSAKDYDLLSHTLMFVKDAGGLVRAALLIEFLLPCAESLFTPSNYDDTADRNVRRALHNSQCAMISLFNGIFCSLVEQTVEETESCCQILRNQKGVMHTLLIRLISFSMTTGKGSDHCTPHLRFEVFQFLTALLQNECLLNGETMSVVESLSLFLEFSHRPELGELACLDQSDYVALCLLKTAISSLRRCECEMVHISAIIEAKWLPQLLKDVNPKVKFVGLRIAEELVSARFDKVEGVQFVRHLHQVTEHIIKLAINQEECYAVLGASLQVLHRMLLNKTHVSEAEIMVQDVSNCNMWADKIKCYGNHLSKNEVVSEGAVSYHFTALQYTLSLVMFLRSSMDCNLLQNTVKAPGGAVQILYSSGLLLQLSSLLEIDARRYERKNGCPVELCLLGEKLFQVKTAIYQFYAALLCSTNDALLIEHISGCGILKQAFRFLASLEDCKVSKQSLYLTCFASVSTCLIKILPHVSLSESNTTLEERQRVGNILHSVLVNDRKTNRTKGIHTVLVLLQALGFYSSDWLRDVIIGNCIPLLEELTVRFSRDATYYNVEVHRASANDNESEIFISYAHTVAWIWDLSLVEPITETVEDLALKSAREICVTPLELYRKMKSSYSAESKTYLMQVASSLIILSTLIQCKAVQRALCDTNSLSRLLTLFSLFLEDYLRDLNSVKESNLLSDALIKKSLLVLCRLLWREPATKMVIAESKFTKTISEIALNSSVSRGFSPFLFDFSFAVMSLLVLPDSLGKGNVPNYLAYSKVTASLGVWINLLKSPNNRKDDVLTASLQAKIEGGLKLLAVATLDMEGCRKAFLGFKGFEDLLNLVTGFNRVLNTNSKRWFLLLLRNFSMNRSLKPVLLSNETWMEFIIDQSISPCSDTVQEAAYSALWCLLYQSQKAVSILKKNQRLDKILLSAKHSKLTKARHALQLTTRKYQTPIRNLSRFVHCMHLLLGILAP